MAGAVISCDQDAFGGLLEWEAEADVDGRFVWYDAPTAGKFYLDVFKPPYSSAKEAIVRPGQARSRSHCGVSDRCTTRVMNEVFRTSGCLIARCSSRRHPLPVTGTRGCRIVLEDGRELIDGIASWWSMCHGYNHPHIWSA